jgi:integrase
MVRSSFLAGKDSHCRTTRSQNSCAMQKIPGTPHGFRSSFKDWAAESGVRDEVSEAALAHADRDKVRAAYRRTRFRDERTELMQRWADFIGNGSAATAEPQIAD